jgi:glycosyltransferase involved in cell wall biosynthesis
MRIVYITSVLGDVGGSEIYCRDIIKGLAAKGHELLVASTEKYKFKEKNIELMHLPVVGHHAFFKFEAPFFSLSVLRKAREFNPDIIFAHSNSMMGIIGHYLKQRLNKPFVLLIELISSVNRNIHTKLIHLTEKIFLPRLNYDKIIIWTEHMKQNFLLPWGIKKERIKVIPASLNLDNYPLHVDGRKVNEKYGKHLITCIKSFWGTNTEGLTYVAKAMKYVKEKHPEYKCLMFGWGEGKKRLEKLSEKLELKDTIIFPGPCTPQECREIWAATEIAPHSYVYEFSTSISLLEYLAMGKACVVTGIGAVKELVKDAAVVVEAKDGKKIAEGINYLIENPKKRKELERKARKLVEQNYSNEIAVERIEKILNELNGS